MASTSNLLFFCFLLCFILPNNAKTPNSISPKGLVIPVTKHPDNQFTVTIRQATPPVTEELYLHLNGEYLWINFDSGYKSSTFKPALCGSPQCSVEKTYGCTSHCYGPFVGCMNATCFNFPYNPVNTFISYGPVGQDVVYVQSMDGYNPGKWVSVPNFVFTATSPTALLGFTSNAVGLAGFGRSDAAFNAQFSKTFGIPNKFAMCLPSSTTKKGVMFFGEGPYLMRPGIDVTKALSYTPYVNNPGGLIYELFFDQGKTYYVGITSIKVNGKPVQFDPSLLHVGSDGMGGSVIVSILTYTQLQSSIYRAIASAFVKGLPGVPRVAPVGDLGLCFNTSGLGRTQAGLAVPPIDFVFQSDDVFWRIHGANSMVEVKKDVACLAFLDVGSNPYTPIMIGTHQQQDVLLHFDNDNSMLGFSDSLLVHGTSCSGFNFSAKSSDDM